MVADGGRIPSLLRPQNAKRSDMRTRASLSLTLLGLRPALLGEEEVLSACILDKRLSEFFAVLRSLSRDFVGELPLVRMR
jgi:hypothetical protein